MFWAVGSVLGVLLETALIIALARPSTSQYERELGGAPATEPEIVRRQRPPATLRGFPAPRESGDVSPSSAAPV